MPDIAVLVVEDEPEVREAIARDLSPFREAFRLEFAEDAEDARAAIDDCDHRGDRLALVLADHLLPGERGTDLLISLHEDRSDIKKVLITGQAGHGDTIRAINQADLDHYIAKPWSEEELQAVVRAELTDWVLENVKDVLPYVSVLDGARLLEGLSSRTWDR